MLMDLHRPSSNAMMFTQVFYYLSSVLLMFIRADDDIVVFFSCYPQIQLLNGICDAMTAGGVQRYFDHPQARCTRG